MRCHTQPVSAKGLLTARRIHGRPPAGWHHYCLLVGLAGVLIALALPFAPVLASQTMVTWPAPGPAGDVEHDVVRTVPTGGPWRAQRSAPPPTGTVPPRCWRPARTVTGSCWSPTPVPPRLLLNGRRSS